MAVLEQDMSEQPSKKKANWIKHSLGFGITAFCLFLFFKQVDFATLRKSLANFDWPYLFLGISMLAFGYSMRIFRWSLMLRAAAPSIKMKNCITPFLGSITLNNILPLRLGDVVRALVFPNSMGIKKTIATTSLIIERLIDLITLLASFAIGILAIKSVKIPVEIKTTAITLAIAGCTVLLVGFLFSRVLSGFFFDLASRRLENKRQAVLCITVGDLFAGFDSMSRPRLLFRMLAVSMMVWVGEAGLFYFVLLGVGIAGSPLVALLVMSLATLSTLVPSSPGYVGPFHLAAFTAVTLIGGTDAQAGAYAVIVHLSLWIPTTLAGAIAIWRHPELFRSTQSQII